MKIAWSRRLVVFALAALAPAMLAAQARKVDELRYPPLPRFEIPQPMRFALPNGMVVMLLEDPELPLVEATALVRTGSRLEPAEKTGLAELTGRVLRAGGTTVLDSDALDDFLESHAAHIESSINLTTGRVRMSCLKQDLPAILAVFADLLRRPAFDEKKLQVAKTALIAGIARQNDDPDEVAQREFRRILYGPDSPYARIETYASLSSVTREDLLAWHRRYYHPNGVVLGLVGDFKAGEARKLIEHLFGDWARGGEPPKVDARWRGEPAPGVFYAEKNDMTQSDIAIGHLGIRRDAPDYYAVEVLNQLFSGGFASRLFSNVRSRKALAYEVWGEVGSQWDYPGLARMFMTTKTETTAAGIEALLEEARNLTAQPPTQEEVDKAKAAILNSFVFNSDSTGKILGQQLTYEYFGYPLDWLQRYRAGIERVSLEEARAAARHFHPAEFSILVVGPAQGLDRPLMTFGKVTPVDLTIPEPPAAPAH